MIEKFKNSSLETIFLLSPCFIAWGLVFNINDIKHVLSKLIFLICIYCFVFHKNNIRDKFLNKGILFFLAFLCLVGSYFSFIHYFNGGHFDFPRAVFACFFYFLFVPYRVFSYQNLLIIVSASSFFTIIKGLYDSYVMGIDRIGEIVNSGPFAYVCSLLLIVQVHFLLRSLNKKEYKLTLINGLLSVFMIYIITLTGTRTAWLGLICVCIYSFILFIKKERFTRAIPFLVLFLVILMMMSDSKLIQERIERSVYEAELVLNGNFNSSLGMRFDMWVNGVVIGSKAPILGVSKDVEKKEVDAAFSRGEMQKGAHKILSHPRSSYHNVYIQGFVKGGVIGLTIMMAWVFFPLLSPYREILSISMPLTIMTAFSSLFESQFTIYSACTYFYLLLIGFMIHINATENIQEQYKMNCNKSIGV
ncbi:O-antigen ligase family protein [Vibrio brasiliensis]